MSEQHFKNDKNLTNINSVQGNVTIYMTENVVTKPSDAQNVHNFDMYIKKANEYFSTKKTLLFADQPHSFYELYVCNNVSYYYETQIPGFQSSKVKEVIRDATPKLLEEKSEYIIIAGTGGIGKSMFLTHMFLSLAGDYSNESKLPVFVTLKDYRDNTQDFISFIWKAVKSFTPKISIDAIIQTLENKHITLMLDGLDELQSSLQEKFNTDLEDFIKAYPGNNILMTSRPTKSLGSFVSFTRFSVFNIEPLEKEQAIALITKLNYWNIEAKENFIKKDLDKHLYEDHKEFASNPLLLTIMLMAYNDFGEVPAKMHVFYNKAYETMAREHDATKGSFKRPFQTNLTPEELARFFAEFCMMTYEEEKIEFTVREFASYMDTILEGSEAQANGVTSQDFLTDITDNLCIMYREGNKYHFIHRSFQEYFTARYLATNYDGDLKDVGDFFENTDTENSITFTDSDKTFDMLYDMIPERVERHIFLPYLNKLLDHCEKLGELEGYWEFLEQQYATLVYKVGITDDTHKTEAKLLLYKTILNAKNLRSHKKLDDLLWPEQVHDSSSEVYITCSVNPADFCIERLETIREIIVKSVKTASFEEGFEFKGDDFSFTWGLTYFINIKKLREDTMKFVEVKKFIEDPSFLLMEEYNNVKNYRILLKTKVQKKEKAKRLSRK